MNEQSSQVLFRQMLLWALFAGCASALAFFGTGLALQDRGMLLSAGAVTAYVGVLLAALWVLGRGDQGGATWLVSLGLVIVAVLLTMAYPSLWVCYAIVPMLAAVVVLQYAPRNPIGPALITCGVATAVIAALGEVFAPVSMRPPLFVTILRIVSLSTTVAFVLLLLWQFRTRLHAALDSLQHRSAEIAAHNATLAQANEQLEQQMHRSAELLDQVFALETPVTTLDSSVLYAPLVGHLTAERADKLRTRLLAAVHERNAAWLIADIQGVPEVDSRVAGELHMTFQALRLLGCEVCLCGITAPVAAVLTRQELAFTNVQTARSPQEALLLAQRAISAAA